MKLKRVLAGVLTGAMMITGIPAFGLELASSVTVYAEDEIDNTGSGIVWDNIAKDKTIKASGTKTVDSGQEDTVKEANAVDGDTGTKWVSAHITAAVPSQSLTIDLEEYQSAVDHITVKFDGEAWTKKYTVQTSHTGRTGSWRDVKVQNKEDYAEAGEWLENTFDRNLRNERMVLRRYVRFVFEGLNDAETNTSAGVAVSEIEIYGTNPKEITAPNIELTPPVSGAYPKIADIKAPAGSNHHTDLSDRTNPASTFIKIGTGTRTTERREVGEGDTKETVDVPIWQGGTESGQLTGGEIFEDAENGVYGFNSPVQTRGTKNKYDVWGNDVKVVSFQLYLKKTPDMGQTIDIFGKSDKFAVQLQRKNAKIDGSTGSDVDMCEIMTYMQGLNKKDSNGNPTNTETWAEACYRFPTAEFNDNYKDRWLDVLIVVDGQGYQRLYVDGKCNTYLKEDGNAIPKEVPTAKGLQPFAFGYNLANHNKEASFEAQLATIRTHMFTTDYGYMARFKFYANANYDGMENASGTDLSDAQTLKNFNFSNTFNLKTLEDAAVEGGGSKNDVYDIITNMLQQEQPTARITLCPYSRSTEWEKYVPNENGTGGTWQGWKDWNESAVERTFTNVSGTKYRAVTKLIADEGFLFSSDVRDEVVSKVEANDSSAVTTVKLSEKSRYLTITTYYGVTGDDDAAIQDNICEIEELIVETGEDEEVKLIYNPAEDATQESVTIPKPQAIFAKCTKHENADVEISYALEDGTQENAYIKLETTSEGGLKITPKQSSKLTIGHVPLHVVVTAALKDGNDPVKDPVNNKAIQKTETIRVEVDEPAASENQKITRAPEIQITAPKAQTYPRVADIRISEEAVHHEDIGDRMDPKATFVQLTKSTMDQYIEEDDRITNENPAQGVPSTVADPKIVNKEGIWAYSGQGQTPGLENKFDVYGKDVKVIAFKLWLEKWPTAGKVSIFGKGSQYAIQLDAGSKDILMFMENDGTKHDGTNLGDSDSTPDKKKHGWPEERYKVKDATAYHPETNPDGFLKRWHNIFMVVDGKKYQRLYVDGNPSVTAEDRKNLTAIATDSPAQGKKPFMFGYNVADTDDNGTPNWWKQLFTEEYGYIADFEFYTDKNYYNMVNGSGDDISAAQVISDSLAKDINITELEENHPGNLDAVITNLLQTSNPAVNISVNPYTAKTVWQQKAADGSVSEPKPKEPFGHASVYTSTTTLTAHDGFEFDPAVKDAVKLTAVAAEGDDPEKLEAPTVTTELKANDKGEANKVLVVTATYAKTESAPCTCGIVSITPQAPINIEIPENETTAQVQAPRLTAADVALDDCQTDRHTYDPDAQKRVNFTYSVPEASSDLIELSEDAATITAKKPGNAAVEIKAEYQYEKAQGEWETITNTAGVKAEKTITVTVNVTKEGAADPEDILVLGTLVTDVKEKFPAADEGDYTPEAWKNLQDALKEAEGYTAAGSGATAAQVSGVTAKINQAVAAMAAAKSEKGLAKDALKAALAQAEALYKTNNADKKYTDASWAAFKKAYEDAQSKLATADAATLKALTNALKAASTTGLKLAENGGTSSVKDGQILNGPNGTYQVVSAKDKTVIITKGKDAKTIKIGPTVVIDKVTYKVIGIGKGAYKGLKLANKVIINANVKEIGANAFEKSKKIKSVTIGKDVAKIGKKAFFQCSKLNKVIIKGKALKDKGVGNSAFKKTAKKASVKWGGVKGKARTKLKKKLKRAGLKVK